MDVQLHHFVAGDLAGVDHVDLHLDALALADPGLGQARGRDVEGGVREAEAERVQRARIPQQIAAAGRGLAVVVDRQLADVAGDADRQLAARIGAAEQDVGGGVAGFLAQVPALDDGVGALGQQVDRQRTAVQQEHHGRLVKVEDRLGQIVLLTDQVQAVAVAKVVVGPGLAAGLLVVAEHHDYDVGLLGDLDRFGDQLGVDGRVDQLDLVLRPDALFGDPHGLGVVEREALGLGLGGQALVQRDDMARRVGIAADRRVLGVRAQERQTLDLLAVQRQHALVVLQQHNSLAGGFAGQGDGVGRGGLGVGGLLVAVGVLEEAALELHGQHAGDGGVDLELRDAAGLHQLRDQGVGFAVGQLDIDAGVHGHHGRLAKVGGQLVAGDQLLDREVVRLDRALVAPLLAQDLGQQPVVGVRGHPVDLVVRRHDRAHRQLLHRALERREEILAQGPFGDLGRADIGAVLGLAVAGHVLEGGEDLVLAQRQGRTLEAADRSQAHLGADVRVLAIGLLDAAPARVAGHVNHGGQGHVRAAGAHLAGGHREDLLGQLGIEGGGQANGLREAGGVAGHEAVQGLVVHQHRDAQAGLLDGPLLGGVGVAGGVLGVAADRAVLGPGGGVDDLGGLEAPAVGRARDLAQAIGEVLRRLFRRELALRRLDPGLGQPDADQLGGLFLDRHPAEQVLDPGVDRLGGVLVERLVA